MVVQSATLEQALAFIERLTAEAEAFPRIESVELGSWAALQVHIPLKDLHSEITPPYMEAFLELQKQIYQLAALVETGIADVGQLSDRDKQELQINVVVSGGSSDYIAKLKEPLEKLLVRMIGKMNGRQAAIVIIATAALLTSGWAFSAWLDHKKTISIEELKSKDHIEALKALSFSDKQHAELFNRLVAVLEQQGDAGKRAVDALAATNDALLKAASKTPKSVINGQTLSRSEAELLRVSPKKKAETKFVKQRMRVVDINTSDPVDLVIVLMEPDTGTQYRIKFSDSLFAAGDRPKLFAALEDREPIWVELARKEVDGEVKSVHFLRCVEPPNDLEQVETD